MIEQSAAANVGLLDETPAPELAVIGTSFSRRANFVPFLSLALVAPVDNRAEDGGGVANAAITYFAKPEFLKTPPRAIVWEIPERNDRGAGRCIRRELGRDAWQQQRGEIALELCPHRALSVARPARAGDQKWLARPSTRN